MKTITILFSAIMFLGGVFISYEIGTHGAGAGYQRGFDAGKVAGRDLAYDEISKAIYANYRDMYIPDEASMCMIYAAMTDGHFVGVGYPVPKGQPCWKKELDK